MKVIKIYHKNKLGGQKGYMQKMKGLGEAKATYSWDMELMTEKDLDFTTSTYVWDMEE